MNKKILSFLKNQGGGYFYSLLLIVFVFLKWKSLHILPWSDENFYPYITEKEWVFFLPWNYRPENFQGHPAGQPFILWLAFKLFGLKVFTARMTALSWSLLCLFSLYKMTSALFQDKQTAFLSMAFAISLPLFWFQSTVLLAHIPLMACGFGAVYAFLSGKYKSLLLFSLGLAVVRESALAFFLLFIFYGLFNPSYRKALYYMIPSLLLFLSHFLVSFVRTGHWSTHPHALGTLPHNPNPEFFNFSLFFERSHHFFKDFFYQFPYVFWWLFLFSLGFFIFSKLRQRVFISSLKQLFNYREKVFIPLTVSALFFCFFISYPEYEFRNFFPILIIFIPLSLHFMIKTLPLFKKALMFVFWLLLIQNVFPKSSPFIVKLGAGVKYSGSQREEEERQRVLKAQTFVVYLEDKWGKPVRELEKWVYMPYPYDQIMSGHEYGYVKNSYSVDHWRFLEEPERYGIVAMAKRKISRLPYNELVYEYLQGSSSFVEQPLPPSLNDFVLFLHKDVLDWK